jgi:hypothetical protein
LAVAVPHMGNRTALPYIRTTRDGRVIAGGEDDINDERKRDALIATKTGGASGSVRSRAERPRNLSSAGTFGFFRAFCESVAGIAGSTDEATMHQIIYLVGLIVVILAILSFFGLR